LVESGAFYFKVPSYLGEIHIKASYLAGNSVAERR
jgi:hypothetical protein